MRFPFKQTIAVAKSISKNKRAKIARFPLVLMLEPLHACNLKCEGCGRIREYAATLSQQLPLEKCIKAINDSNAPVVSICGGEPLLYKDIAELVRQTIALGKVTYLCTNGTILDWKLDAFKPHPMFNINVHIDGMERTHDAITNRPGTFGQITENIRAAKKAGFTICTNTTVYKETTPEEIGDLFAHLQFLDVDGMLISPGFEYEVITPHPIPLPTGERVKGEGELFMSRSEITDKFRKIRKFSKKYRVWSTPLYLDFLGGLREYNCTPWGNVTYNIEGWKAPCYLITDKHFDDFKEFMGSVDWNKYQSRADKRCANCMVHSGFEASVALETGSNLKDSLRMAWWTLF
jgi:hopanoid biosynthesis associated radical SAM protein HpnH